MVAGAGLALLLALAQSGMSRPADPQGMRQTGVILLALPVGAVLAVMLGPVLDG